MHTFKSVASSVKYSPVLDFQAHLVYNAEDSIYYSKPKTLAWATKYVDSITGTLWWKNRTPKKAWDIAVVAKGGKNDMAYADYHNSRILLPDWALEPVTIIHELTHIILSNRRTRNAWHGPEFAWIECQVLKHYDPRMHRKLVTAFGTYGVITKPPKFKMVR